MINILLIDQERKNASLLELRRIVKKHSRLQAAIIHRLYFVMLFLAWRMELLSVILLRSIFLRLRPIFYQITVVSR